MADGLDALIAAGPWPQRTGLRFLLAVARRPRGAALLARIPPADQVALSLLALAHYDEPATAARFGWDAAGVVERGRALRRREGRP
jgi:hypothetical protein